jgi:hypothetical protein
MKTNSEKVGYWRQQIEAFKSSGLTRRTYCEGNGIKLSTLDYWRQKLSPSGRENKKVTEAGWIPLQISDDGPSSGIELRIGRITIAVKPGFDPALLVDVLRTINTLC